MKDGDRNTKFFLSSTINKSKLKRIDKIKSNEGKWLDKREEIGEAFCVDFKKIMETTGPRDLSKIQKLIRPTVTEEENNDLIAIPDPLK